MFQKFKNHIANHFPFILDEKILIAVSGGIDSVVLSYLCKKLSLNFDICHCNFQLRGKESEEDERFVKNLAHQLQVNFYGTSFETENYALKNKLSIQIAARDLRYQWFYELIDVHNYSYVLTGHNTNDNLETFLINLTRGSGLDGFTGIPPINNKAIRPLLDFSRDEIMMFAIKNGIEWREDKSNANVKYVRNKVRHKIIPILKEINPHLLESFKNSIQYLNESQQIIDDRIHEVSKKLIKKSEKEVQIISIKKLKKLSNPKAYLFALLKEFGFTEWNDVTHLLEAQTGKQLFSKTHRLLKNRDELLLTSINDAQKNHKIFEIESITTQLIKPFSLRFEETEHIKEQNKKEIVVDKNVLKFPLKVRKWKYGDYFYPSGMIGSKKISQYFKDKKMSLLDKENSWLLTNAEDEIIWVIGMRQDKRSEISNSTKSKIKIIIS